MQEYIRQFGSGRKALALDFEFFNIVEKKVTLVCCSTYDIAADKVRQFWLLNNPEAVKELNKYLNKFDTFLTFAAIAECRSFISLGRDPMAKEIEWIDLFLEYRLITNNNDKLMYGKQLVDGKVKSVRKPKPKWERTEQDQATGFKPKHSLAEATFKLTGRIRDTDHKTKMRDIIISGDVREIEINRGDIMAYCTEDVVDLPNIWSRTQEEFYDLAPKRRHSSYIAEAFGRGRYSALTAVMESNGYPIDVKATKNFSKAVGLILFQTQRQINKLFPEIKPFRWNKKTSSFTWNQKITKGWIKENHDSGRWMKTDGGDLSLSLDAWQRYYDYKHDYPEDSFGAQMVRFLKLKQNLYGFNANNNGRRNFWDFVGKDGLVRPYMNIFGAQSSRSQPAATGFMFLKPAWMRALVVPPKGYFMAGIDYGSQEFFISALQANDDKMIAAYLSGDPYLTFAKLTGAVPPNGTKETHSAERDLAKATVLGLSYLMSKYGLANKLTADTGREWTEDEAQEQIDLFYDTFWKLQDYQQKIQDDYETQRHVRLEDGWYMWGDNDNFRSVGNVPIQGNGSVCMRRAAIDAHYKGIQIAFTLHDAIYMIGKVGRDEHKIAQLRDSMRSAFVSLFPPELADKAKKIRLDPKAWSLDYPEPKIVTGKDGKPKEVYETIKVGKHGWEVPVSRLHIDRRAKADYDRFKIYFEDRFEDKL